MDIKLLDDVYLELDLPAGRPFQVIGFGENAVDWVCRVPEYPQHDTKVRMEKMLRMGGGQIATACSVCARYGLKTRYVGRVGSDDLGDFVQRDLGRESMDVVLEVVSGATSHHSLIIVDRETGCRTIIWDQDARLRYDEGELNRTQLIEGQILHVDGNDLPASTQAAAWAQEAGMAVCLDIDKVPYGVEHLIKNVDLLIASLSFVTQFAQTEDWRSGLIEVAKYCPGFVAVTLGEEGSAALVDGEVFQFPAFPIEPVDSTGAGDVFHGAFIYGVLSGWPVGRCMRFSNAAGGLACTHLGARAGIPTLPEVLQLESSR
ncbi:MAG: carbohydrate kinase family protein [Acidobacteriota bacterium]|nr:MAG: carbohydrate kinase family protein [Acidobacteriota bacterium]